MDNIVGAMRWYSFTSFLLIISYIYLLMSASFLWSYSIKIKNLTELAGVKKNFFVGYGLVTGLSGTGDRRSRITQKSLNVILKENGIDIEERFISTRNSAAVMVTAETSGFLEKGDKIDVTVTSLGDARSLKHGVLLPTPLKAGNKTIYVVASGILALAHEANVMTRGVVIEGGVIERNLVTPFTTSADPNRLYGRTNMVLRVKGDKLERSALIRTQIESAFSQITVQLINDKTLVLTKKDNSILTHANILAILNTEVELPSERIVVIDQGAGIVIAGGTIEIDPSFISLQNLSLELTEPSLESLGYLDSEAQTEQRSTYYTTVAQLVTELQTLDLDGYQIGSIFQALKKSGAINAEIIFQ